MQQIFEALELWRSRGERMALATVVRVRGSAPRGPGAALLVAERGAMAGSVSGGCVEAAVVEAGLEAIASGERRVLAFGISDEQAWEVGLACGGELDILVEPLGDAAASFLLDELRPQIAGGRAWASALVLNGPHAGARWLVGNAPLTIPPVLAGVVAADAPAMRATGTSEIRAYAIDGATEVFVATGRPAPRLVIVGGVHIAAVLCPWAKELGFSVTIVDPRTAFANRERFPAADEVINLWPDEAFADLGLDESTFVAVLTHDPKLDDPAILAALARPVRYVGVLGSRKTQESRRARLREQGVCEADLARLRGPIGLPIRAKTPAEIALSIMAELVAVYRARPNEA